MATLNLQPPGPLCFHKAEDWPKWICQFEQYRLASGLSEKAEEHQVSTLLYCLGENAEDVLDTTRISVENKKKYDRVVEEFANYFKVRKMLYMNARTLISVISCPVNPWKSSSRKYTGWEIVVTSGE